MHTLATRSHCVFCEKYLSKTTNTLLYISTRVSPIAFKIFLRVPRCLGTNTAVITQVRQNAGSGRFSQIRSHITACLAQEKIDYIGFSPHLWFCAYKTASLGLELQASVGPRNDLSYCACTTACLASESLVSMGPSPHLLFLHAKQRL